MAPPTNAVQPSASSASASASASSSAGPSSQHQHSRASSVSSAASGSSSSASQRKKQAEIGGLICRVKYCNTLPDLPFDAKFLAYPFDAARFIKYNTTSLEKEYKHELLTEFDLGIDIDLVNPDTYRAPVSVKPDPDDEALAADESGLLGGPGSMRLASRHEKMKASWLRKTEYISNEANRQNQVFSDKIESKINLKNKVYSEAEDIYKTKEKQIEAIERTFEATRRPVEEHYSKRGVHAVQVMPLLPDFDLWQHPCAQVIFDSDPTPKDAADDVTQAMIRGMVDESGDQFVAYFLPTRETRAKRKRDRESGLPYDPEDMYEYELSREYNWNVKNKSMKGYDENYFFVFRGGCVYYNELETRVRLSKRRKIGQPGGAPSTKTKLVVRHRDFNQGELEARRARMAGLEPAEELDDDDDEEEEEEEEEELHDAAGEAEPAAAGVAAAGDAPAAKEASANKRSAKDAADLSSSSSASGTSSESSSSLSD